MIDNMVHDFCPQGSHCSVGGQEGQTVGGGGSTRFGGGGLDGNNGDGGVNFGNGASTAPPEPQASLLGPAGGGSPGNGAGSTQGSVEVAGVEGYTTTGIDPEFLTAAGDSFSKTSGLVSKLGLIPMGAGAVLAFTPLAEATPALVSYGMTMQEGASWLNAAGSISFAAHYGLTRDRSSGIEAAKNLGAVGLDVILAHVGGVSVGNASYGPAFRDAAGRFATRAYGGLKSLIDSEVGVIYDEVTGSKR